MSDLRAVIFDFDGLVLDSETPLFDIWAGLYTERGQTLTLAEWQHALGTQGGFDPYEDLSRRAACDLDRDEIGRWVSSEHWRLCGDQPLLPGVRDRLLEARELDMGTAVASSSSAAWVRPWLERHDLMSLVDVLCTRDDVSRVKPAPDLFLLAAERLSIAPAHCVVFEDSPNGVRAARAAGMVVVAVPGGLTRTLAMPDPHAEVPSLAHTTLRELRDRFARETTTSR